MMGAITGVTVMGIVAIGALHQINDAKNWRIHAVVTLVGVVLAVAIGYWG